MLVDGKKEFGKDPKLDNSRDRTAIRPRAFHSSDRDRGLFTACWFAREQQFLKAMKSAGGLRPLRSNLKSTLPARRSGVFNIVRLAIEILLYPCYRSRNPQSQKSSLHLSRTLLSLPSPTHGDTRTTRFEISSAAMIRLSRLYYFIPPGFLDVGFL